MRSSKTKREMDTWSGHVGVVLVMNMLETNWTPVLERGGYKWRNKLPERTLKWIWLIKCVVWAGEAVPSRSGWGGIGVKTRGRPAVPLTH